MTSDDSATDAGCMLCDEDDGHMHTSESGDSQSACCADAADGGTYACTDACGEDPCADPDCAYLRDSDTANGGSSGSGASGGDTTAISHPHHHHYHIQAHDAAHDPDHHPHYPHHHHHSHHMLRCFPCPHPGCGMSFFRKQNLKAHMCVHSEIRAFACPKCPASFRRRQELQRHVRTVHAEPEMRRPFACPGCGTAFGRHDALKRHILANGGTVGPDAVTPWACSAPKTRQRSANPNPRLQVDRAAVKSDSVNS